MLGDGKDQMKTEFYKSEPRWRRGAAENSSQSSKDGLKIPAEHHCWYRVRSIYTNAD